MAVQAFQCTSPKPSGPLNWRKPHPKPYELRVQSGIRTENPKGKGSTMLLGLDSSGIGAIVCWCVVGPEQYKILAVAVALRHRGKDGGHAKEALETAMEVMEADAVSRGFDAFTMHAWVDRRNWASQKLFSASGFAKGESIDADLCEWTREVPLLEG